MMDISKHLGSPKDLISHSALNADLKPVAIETLKLEAARTYIAKVLGQLASDPQMMQSNQNAEPAKTAESANQWLIKLSGRSVLVNTSIPLQKNQTIEVQYRPGDGLVITRPASTSAAQSSQDVSSLIRAVSQTMARQIPLSEGFEALRQIASQTTPASPPLSQQAQLLTAILDSALSSTKQIVELSTLLRATENRAPAIAAPAEASGPSASNSPSTVNASRELSQEASLQALVRAIKHSGIAYEASLLKPVSGENPRQAVQQMFQSQVLIQQALRTLAGATPQTGSNSPPVDATLLIQSVRELLQAPSTPSTPTTPSTGPADQSLNTATTPVSSGPSSGVNASSQGLSSDQLSASQALLQHAKRLLDSTPLKTLLTNTHSASPAPSASGSGPPLSGSAYQLPSPDLKGVLMQLVAALSQMQKSPPQEAGARPGLEGLAQPELLKQAFEFPHMLSLNASAKRASHILADQELSTGQLLKLLAGMLNRIHFNQLNSVYQSQTNTADNVTQQSWFVELPILNGQQVQSFQIRIDKEEEKNRDQEKKDKKPQWTIALSFDLESLGPIHVQVKLSPPAVSSTLWAEQASTHALLEKERSHFRERLQELGLEVDEIVCQQGQPKATPNPIQHNLVDIKA